MPRVNDNTPSTGCPVKGVHIIFGRWFFMPIFKGNCISARREYSIRQQEIENYHKAHRKWEKSRLHKILTFQGREYCFSTILYTSARSVGR